MLKGLSTQQRIEYVSKQDDTEPKTIFVIRPLSGLEMLDMSGLVNGNKMSLDSASILSLLDKSIVEVKNFGDDVDKATIIRNLPVDILVELTEKIGELNKITESDKKK